MVGSMFITWAGFLASAAVIVYAGHETVPLRRSDCDLDRSGRSVDRRRTDGGGLLDSVSSAHALTAFWSILMMNIGLMGIIYRAEKRFMLIEPDSLLMIAAYVLGLWLLFR
jgi:hypothetical protein